MLSCRLLYFAISKALNRMSRGSGVRLHASAFFVYVVGASYCGSVHIWEYSRVV